MDLDKFMKLATDMEAKKDWDKNLLEAKSLKKINDVTDILYMAVKMPFIMSNRDFLFQRHTINN